jgi:transposase-like protein
MARGTLPGRVKDPSEYKQNSPRPRKQPPADALEIITAACATGASKQGVAMALGCDRSVLERWLHERPDLAEAFARGKERERQTLHDVLYETATKGEGRDAIIAAMFLLKARHGYVEGEKEGQANRVNINFTIPGAQPLKDFMVIEHESNDRTQ